MTLTEIAERLVTITLELRNETEGTGKSDWHVVRCVGMESLSSKDPEPAKQRAEELRAEVMRRLRGKA